LADLQERFCTLPLFDGDDKARGNEAVTNCKKAEVKLFFLET
jgi:Fe-S-cluster formation regulator IscX/YfhJ